MLEQKNQPELNGQIEPQAARTSVMSKSGTTARKLNLPIFYIFGGLAVLGVIIEQILFPNLKDNLFFLTIVSLTTIFGFLSVGLTLSGLRARMSRPAKLAVSVLVWGFALLDVIFLLLPSVLPGATSNDAAVNFAGTSNTAAVNTVQAPKAMTGVTQVATLSGTFNNQGDHAVAGNATIGKTTDGKNVLRFENFNSANGPDLHVYLSKEASPANDKQVRNGIEVSKLKATQGNLNYDLDGAIDLSQYKSVVIYCNSASAIFGYADLS